MTSPSDFVCTTRLGRSGTRDGPASAILRDRPPQKGAAAARRAKKETRDALALPNRFRKNPTLARTARAFRNAAQSHTPARHLGRSPQLGQVRVQGVLVIHPILRHYGAVRASGRRSAPCARSGVVRGTNRWHRARRHDRRCDTRAARTSCAKGCAEIALSGNSGRIATSQRKQPDCCAIRRRRSRESAGPGSVSTADGRCGFLSA